MTRAPAPATLLLLSVGGCGLVMDLPDARVDDAASTATGGLDSTGGNDGASDGGGAGDGNQPSEVTGGKDSGSTMGGAAPTGGASDLGGAPETGGSSPSGGTGCEDPCDCDGDGAARGDAECGGTDCDDSDARVHPDQTQFFAEPANDDVGFDYNCDTDIQRPAGQDEEISCAAISLGNCSSVQGFQQVPACGESAAWGKCVTGTLNCSWSVLEENRVVRCH